MAYPNSPEVGLEGSSGLDHLIKNTEFENIQHTKAIETERERITAYKSQLEERKQQTVELENSTVALNEQTKKLHTQFIFNQENFESLKHTSTVLGDHEDALRRKLSTLQTDVEQEYSEQTTALSKYERIWATYQAKYESKEKVRLLRSKEEQLHTFREHNAQLEKQILELEQTIHAMKQNQGRNSSLVSWVLQIAALRCETSHHLKLICAEIALAGTLRLEIGELKAKMLESQALIEKREMEAKLAIQRQQQAEAEQQEVMETNASYASTISKDFQAPNFAQLPPGIMTSAGFIQTPLSLQPLTTITSRTTTTMSANSPTQLQLQIGNNKSSTERGQQQKKATSRFLPQLSMPQPCPITNATPANVRAQVSITTRPNIQQHTGSSQATAKTNQKRVAQLQMPSLHMPLRPKLSTTSTVHHHTTKVSSSTQNQNASLTVAKSSLQISMPAQVEKSRPAIHQAINKNATQIQPRSADAALQMPQMQQQNVGPLSPERAGNGTALQQDNTSDSNTAASDTSQEMQTVEKIDDSVPQVQDTPSMTSGSKESDSHNSDEITEASRTEGSSVFNATDVRIQQPLTPTQQDTMANESAVNMTTTSTTTANSVDMQADPPITTYTDPTFTSFNQAPPQQMDTADSAMYPFNTTSSQDPTSDAAGNGYAMYGTEMYQQHNQQGNAMAGQFFDGGMNGAFGQSNGFDGIFSGTGSPSSFDGGSFFGGPPATPQQQQTSSGGFGFSFGGGSTPTSSGSMFNFF